MLPLDIALRAAGVSVLLLTALALLSSSPRSAVARWFLPFALGLSGFLAVNTGFDAAEPPAPLWAAASFLSRMAALFLWLFCLALFDGAVRRPAVALGVAGLWLALVVIDKEYFAGEPAGVDPSALLIALGVAMIGHAAWRVMRGLRDDLVERRRRARPLFAAALLALLAVDFAVDALLGYAWRPETFLLLQNGAIVALAAALALWLLQASPRVVVAAEPAAVPAATPRVDDPERPVLARLEELMRRERPYLDPGLTFERFARQAGVPEPALRRVINHRLGFAHFRNFLNAYRIEEAKRRLRDPARREAKMIAIAFDSGFASLASFNRTFRQAVGQAPSEYRRAPPAGDAGLHAAPADPAQTGA